MARLKNSIGVIVHVADSLVPRLGIEWVSADEQPKRKPGRPKKSEAQTETVEPADAE